MPKETIDVKVSIIVPVFNTAKYLDTCLRSLTSQTFRDIEIICIDDGSKDKSYKTLQIWADYDKRIKLIKQENAGPSKARNEGLKIAKGEYIAFVDSDDYVDQDFFEKLYEAAERNHCDIACATILRKRKKSEKYRVHYTEEKIYTTLEDKIKTCDIPTCCYVWNKLYKKELIDGMNFQEGALFEDVLWVPEVIKKSNNLVTVPNTQYYYVVRKDSIVKKQPNKQKQIDSYNAKKYIVEFFDKNNLPLSQKNRKLTKKVYFVFNIPFIKVKEFNNIETYLLFGLVPIFKKGG